MSQFSDCVERASVDEAYIDLTDKVDERIKDEPTLRVTADLIKNTSIVGYPADDNSKYPE